MILNVLDNLKRYKISLETFSAFDFAQNVLLKTFVMFQTFKMPRITLSMKKIILLTFEMALLTFETFQTLLTVRNN